MALLSVSLRDICCMLLAFSVLILEWNVGASIPAQEQLEYFMWIGMYAVALTGIACLPFDERCFVGETFSFKSCVVSMSQQLCLVVISTVMAVRVSAQKDASGVDWMREGSGIQMSFERHVHFYCIGAMLKDFWLPGSFDMGFVFHHLVAITGCGMCLVLPVGFGAATLNACQAESSSAFYNLMFVLPVAVGGGRFLGKCFQWLYMVSMFASHVVAIWIGTSFARDMSNPAVASSDIWWTWWRVAYVFLCVLLVAFRVVGQLLYARQILFSDWVPALNEDSSKKK